MDTDPDLVCSGWATNTGLTPVGTPMRGRKPIGRPEDQHGRLLPSTPQVVIQKEEKGKDMEYSRFPEYLQKHLHQRRRQTKKKNYLIKIS